MHWKKQHFLKNVRAKAKCYLTWDADFKWFTSDDPLEAKQQCISRHSLRDSSACLRYVPILSGGLLGISKRWWNETGGRRGMEGPKGQ